MVKNYTGCRHTYAYVFVCVSEILILCVCPFLVEEEVGAPGPNERAAEHDQTHPHQTNVQHYTHRRPVSKS